MKKFIWIASYPKSGNTMLRLFLSAYFFSDNGKIDSLKIIKNIINFQSLILKLPNVPTYDEFKKDLSIVCPLWIQAQKFHSENIKNSILIKTHSFMGNFNNHPLTNKEYTKGFIHIIRDPRSVAISNMHHYNFNLEESVQTLLDNNRFSLGRGAPVPEIIASWNNHYLSWKKFKSDVPGITIRYEDLITDPNKKFYEVLIFLKKLINFEINEQKFNNVINSIQFNNLKNLEKNEGFDEKLHGNSFFRKGLKDEWKKTLPENIKDIIENNFKNEMKELDYL